MENQELTLVYENLQLYKNHCSDYTSDENIYRKLAGYTLDEEYISKETSHRIVTEVMIRRN